MRLFVSLLSGENSDQGKLYCDTTRAQSCDEARQEAINRDLPFESSAKMEKVGDTITASLNAFDLPTGDLKQWADTGAAIDWLKSGINQLKVRNCSATPSGHVKAVISADNFDAVDFQPLLGYRIDIGISVKVLPSDHRPVRDSTIKCEE